MSGRGHSVTQTQMNGRHPNGSPSEFTGQPPTQAGTSNNEEEATPTTKAVATSSKRWFKRVIEPVHRLDAVEQLEAEAEQLREVDRIERENVHLFTSVRDRDERDADHKVDRKIRARQRQARLTLGLSHAEAEERIAKRTAKLDQVDDQERIDERKALAKRRKITNPNAALAVAYKRWKQYSFTLALVAAAGIAFTSYAVAQGLGGAEPNPLFFIVEPLFSIPLMIIVLVQSFAAQHGRLNLVEPVKTVHLPREYNNTSKRLTAIGWIEIGSLLGSIGLAALGTYRAGDIGSPLFVARILAPIMVVVVVSLQYVLAKVFGAIISELQLGPGIDEENVRKAALAANALVKVIRADIARNDLSLEDDGLPSISLIMRRYKKSKVTAGVAHDMLANPTEGR